MAAARVRIREAGRWQGRRGFRFRRIVGEWWKRIRRWCRWSLGKRFYPNKLVVWR